MRKTLVVALLVLAVAFAGCSGKSPATGDDDGGGDRTSDRGDRTSVPGSTNNTDPPHDDIDVFSQDVMLVGQASQTFEVNIPPGVTAIDFNIHGSGQTEAATAFSMFKLNLDGCGSYDQGTGFSGGSVTLADRLCKDAAEGKRTLTVENVGFVQGPLKLTGQVPKSNETAAP